MKVLAIGYLGHSGEKVGNIEQNLIESVSKETLINIP